MVHPATRSILRPIATASGRQSLVVLGEDVTPSQAARYAHLTDDPVKAASDAVDRHIAAAMEAGRAARLTHSRGSRPVVR